MKITHLLEGSEAGMPSTTQPAPKFGRSEDQIEETTVAGNVGGGAPTNMGMQRRGKGSMFQGIKTSKKFVNSPVTEDDISEEHISAKQRREEFFNKSESRDIGNRPQNKDILPKQTYNSDPEYDDEAGMIKTNLHTSLRAVKGLHKVISDGENCPEWVQEKIAVASDYLVTCWDYMISQHEQGRKYEMNEGYYSNYDNNRTGFRKPRPDVTGEEEPQGMFMVMINGRPWKEFTSNKAFTVAKTLADKNPTKTIQVRWPTGQLNTVKEGQWKDIDGASAPPKGAKLQTKTIEPGSAIRVDPKYKEPTAPTIPKDNGMGRIVQGTWQADPKGTVKAPSGDPEGVREVAPPGAKAERMVKHIKKSYSKDGKITPKEKSIAYATAWKAHNKGKVEEQGVAEGAKEDMSKEAKAMASGKCPHCHGPVEKKEHPTLTQYHCAKCGIRASIDKQGVAEGFPHDVDHMPGPVIRNADMTTDNVKTKDKAEWDRATDSINARVFDDMSEFRTDSKGETVVGDSAVWAKWDNATQTGWFNAKGRPLKPWPVKEQGVAEELKMKHQRDTYGPETGNGTPLNRRPDNSNSLASRDSVRAEVPNITKSADGHPTVKYNFTGKTTATRVEPTITSKSVPRLDSNKPIPNFLKTRPMPAPQLKSIPSDGNFPSNKRNEPHVVPPLRIGKTDGEEDQGVAEESKGLWANIHAKRERIKHGSGEKMRKPGSKGAPTADALRKSAK